MRRATDPGVSEMSGEEYRTHRPVADGESDGLGADVRGVRGAGVVALRQARAACDCGWATRLIVVPADVVSVPCPRCGEETRVR